MSKCVTCGKFLTAKEGVGCNQCKGRFHSSCVRVPRTMRPNSDWHCPECSVKIKNTPVKGGNILTTSAASGDSTSVAAGDVVEISEQDGQCIVASPPQTDDIAYSIRLLWVEVREMRNDIKSEIRAFRRELTELHAAVSSCNERLDGLETRLEALEGREEIENSTDAVGQLQRTVSQLQRELDDRHQESLAADLEISNLPENSGENVLHTMVLVARKLGVELDARDIVFAERVGARVERSAEGAAAGGGPAGSARGRRIVVRLARRRLRDDLLQGARTRRGATTADLGFSTPPLRFYLNERLTRRNKLLFHRTRQAAAQNGWRYAWTRGGKIFTRQSDGKRSFGIHTDADIDRVFGKEMECDVKK